MKHIKHIKNKVNKNNSYIYWPTNLKNGTLPNTIEVLCVFIPTCTDFLLLFSIVLISLIDGITQKILRITFFTQTWVFEIALCQWV